MPARGTKASASTRSRCAASLYVYNYSLDVQRIVSLNVSEPFYSMSEYSTYSLFTYLLMFSLFSFVPYSFMSLRLFENNLGIYLSAVGEGDEPFIDTYEYSAKVNGAANDS